MGLDCNVFARAKNATEDTEATELWYGRKTNEIHGWMEQQWFALNPEKAGDAFNCEDLDLTPDLLNQLEEACVNEQLKQTIGFFFGEANDAEAIALDVQQILTASRQAIADGLHVYYTSWW